MRVPLSWLSEMVPLGVSAADASAVAALSGDLDSLGLVVEGVEHVGAGLGDIVVARVLEIAAIKGADRIRRVVVDAGGSDSVEVVCGAWNFEVGDVVPFAPVGAVLPGELRIERRKMRGVTSNGMLCSARELRLSQDHEGILVLGGAGSEGSGGAEPGRPLVDFLGIEPEVVFDLAIEGNRPDCLCIAGVARDVAALRGLPLLLPEPVVAEGDEPAASLATVAVLEPRLCSRLVGRVLTGVTSVPSPATVARRLTLCGMRPIDSVVDASNYVMLELGQPTHPYDLDRLGGHGLSVRAAVPGETVVTLDGVTRTLGTRTAAPGDDAVVALDCVICDATDRPVGIAGVMGGRSSEITAGASRILLEVASFDSSSIGRTARFVGLRSEASVRFERGVDQEGVERAADRVSQLIIDAAIAAGAGLPVVARGLLDAHPVRTERRRIALRTERVNSLLGTALGPGEVEELLAPLGFTLAEAETGAVGTATDEGLGTVQAPAKAQVFEVPSFRPDALREVDLVEEVARRLGYQELPARARRSPYVGRLSEVQALRRRLRRIMTGLNASEAWTTSIVDPRGHAREGIPDDLVLISNPMVAEESALRSDLRPGLLAAVRLNAGHRRPYVRLFEIGDVFFPPDPGQELPREREQLGLVLSFEGDGAVSAVGAWRVVAESLRLADVELQACELAGLHPARSATLLASGVAIGTVGEIEPAVLEEIGLVGGRVGWLGLDVDLVSASPRLALEAVPVSHFPSSDVDLAFVVPEGTPAGTVESVLRSTGGELCESVRLFDVYRGPGVPTGARSLAYRVRLCALDHTLTEAEIAETRARLIEAVEETVGARLRS